MQETDDQDNGVLHYAFRSRKAASVEIMIRSGFGDLQQRNKLGQIATETPH